VARKLASRYNHLKSRIRTVAKKQPEIHILREKLLALGGEEIVASPPEILDPTVPLLADRGQPMPFPAEVYLMKASNCHGNVVELWRTKKRPGLFGVATGFALFDDGLWRRHSWGVGASKAGYKIVETTDPRMAYFGIGCGGQGADVICDMLETLS
jgi:hypothetical protein